MKIKEIHSSELTASCMRYVQLRLEGKTRPAATGALFRGLVVGEAMRILHEQYLHGKQQILLYAPVVVEAAGIVRKTLESEGRMLTPAVEQSMHDIIDDIVSICTEYVERLGPRFEKWTLLGCEVPVRWKYAPRMPEFASHVDAMFRDEHGNMVIIDWKLRETAPTYAYLARNMQLACYYACALEGKFLLSDGLSTEWKGFGEEARCVWVHLNHLQKFGRKTKCEDDRGMEVEFNKGDSRPIRMTWREIEYANTSAVEDIRAELMTKARMIKKDIFPTNPDPVGCSLCEAESFCTRFDTVI